MSIQINKMLVGMSAINSDAPLLEKVFYNENILEQIFQFLPIKELVTTRLVCSKWKSESDRILKLRPVLIVIKTDEDIHRIKYVMDKQKATGSSPLFKNFLIVFDRIRLEQEVVVEFLNSHGSSFEQLSLQFNWILPRTQNTPQSFKYLLEKQVPNLKSLQFFGFSEDLWQSGELFNDSTNLLPNLKHIGCITVNNYRHAWECPLYLSLFNRFPSVKKITINCSNYWDIIFSQAVSDTGNRLRKFLSEVEEINTGLFDDRMLLRMVNVYEQLQPVKVPNILKLMPQLCPKVKTLRLWFDSDNITNSDVGNVLKKYAGQIEELWLNVSDVQDYENDVANEDQPDVEVEAVPSALINEFLMTPVFNKLRVIRTGVDILQPSSTVTQFFHKQLPMLESLWLMYKVPLLVWNRDIQHFGLRKLQLCVEDAEYLLPIGQAFPNIRILCLIVNGDAALQLVARAFPNLEEISVSCYSSKLSHDGIKCIGDLHHLRHLSVRSVFTLSEVSINWLKQLSSLIFLNISCPMT